MARQIFSNDSVIVDNFIKHNKSVGFDKYTPHSFNDAVIGATFNKLEIEHTNTYESNEGTVSIVGTYIYKKAMGGEACRLVLEEFRKTKNIVDIRDNMIGHFAMVIICDGDLYAISDNLGVFYLYYHFNEKTGKWVVGNSLYEMVKSATFECHVDEFNFLEESYSHNVYGEETIFIEFNKVTGERYLKVNLLKNKFEILPASVQTFDIDNRSVDEIADDFAAELKAWSVDINDAISGLRGGGLFKQYNNWRGNVHDRRSRCTNNNGRPTICWNKTNIILWSR